MKENNHKIVSGVFWRFGEKFTAQAVSFIVSIILARLLLPEDFGIVAIMNVFISIAEVFVTSGLGAALIQKKDVTQKECSTLFWCNLIISFGLYCILFLISPLIARFYGIPLLCPVLRVFGIRLPINAINSIQHAIVSKKMEFKKFFYATIGGTVVSAVIGIVMAYYHFGVWALISQMLVNTIIDTLVLLFCVQWKPSFEFSFNETKPLISYGWKILATDLIGTAYNQLNSFIIGKSYSSADLAYYTQGKKIPELINLNVGSTISTVLYPAMSLTDNLDEIKNIRRKSLRMLEYVMFPIMFGMFAIADKIIIVFFTNKWTFAIPYLRISCVAAIVGIPGTTLLQEIKAIGRSDVALKLEFVKKPLFVGIILIAMNFGVKAVAYTVVINAVLSFCINVYPVKKYIGFDFKEIFTDARFSFTMSFVMGVCVYSISNMFSNPLLSLLISGIFGIIIYWGLSVLFHEKSYLALKQFLVERVKK